MPKPEKDYYIETLRGFTILLVVASHVIGIDAEGGMRVADDSIWRYIYYTLCSNYITMPLFTAIAGWVYDMRPVRTSDVRIFLYKKALRLLLPMIFTGTVYYLVRALIPGTNVQPSLDDIWRIYIFPHSIYWYLPALFLIFCAAAAIDYARRCRSLAQWGGWLALSTVAYLTIKSGWFSFPDVLGIKSAMAMLPYFLVGMGLHRFGEQLATPAMRRIYGMGLAVSLAALQVVWFVRGNDHWLYRHNLHLVMAALSSACLLVWRQRPRVGWLEQIGQHAYPIYLFHVFGTAGGRILCTRAGLGNGLTAMLCSLALGILVPMAIERLLYRCRPAALLFMGRYRR